MKIQSSNANVVCLSLFIIQKKAEASVNTTEAQSTPPPWGGSSPLTPGLSASCGEMPANTDSPLHRAANDGQSMLRVLVNKKGGPLFYIRGPPHTEQRYAPEPTQPRKTGPAGTVPLVLNCLSSRLKLVNTYTDLKELPVPTCW